MRTTKKGPARDIFNFSNLLNDTTVDKIASHRRLQAEIENDPNSLENIFKKKEIITLCNAYQVPCSKSMTKYSLCKDLASKIITSSSLPIPAHFDPKALLAADEVGVESESTSQEAIGEQPAAEPLPSSSGNQDHSHRVSEPKVGKGKRKGKAKGKGRALSKRPKPAAVEEFPCGTCSLECVDECVFCEDCKLWFHFDCVGVTEETIELLVGKNWYCSICAL